MRERSLIMVMLTVLVFLILLAMIIIIGFAMILSMNSSGSENPSAFAQFITAAEMAIYSWASALIGMINEAVNAIFGSGFMQ
jgi:uncharacterized protein (UPF0333 family)